MWSQGAVLLALLLPVFSQVLKNEDYRLPFDVYPISYKLTLNPDLDSLTFIGNLTFTFRPLKNLQTLILNSKNLLIDPIYSSIGDDTGNAIQITQVLENKDLERILIQPSQYFAKGRIYAINFNYQGNITEDGSGLYRSSYVDNGKKEWALVSQMRPVHARQVFPCLDEPSFRAKFKLSVWHTRDYQVVSNMPPLVTEVIGERALTEFEETPAIPVFLTGLLMSKFGSVSGDRGFVSLAVPEEVPSVAYSAEIGPKLATAMELQLGIAYPQKKTHQVALPRLVPVAMENWGLFNFRKENILYSPTDWPTVQKQTVARFSGHEVSHTWIGNSVTLAWWDYLWLSEMFAMYLEYFLPHLVEPHWRMDEQMAVDLAFSGLAGDSPQADPLTTRVLTPQQVSAKFSGLTYTKGPGLLRMVQHAMTLPNFFSGVKSYVETYWEKSVTPAHLWQTLEQEVTFPDKLETLMYQWTDQPGYPLVTVSLERGGVVLSQEPFSADGTKGLNGSWWIPISTLTSEEAYPDTRPKFWIPPGQALRIPAPGKWIMVNVDGTGFFRTSYDPELFSRLSHQLQTDHSRLPPLSRAILVDDAVWLSRAGLLDIRAALGLISYLSSELDFIVWKSAAISLDVLDSLLLHSKLYPLYKSYVASLVNNIYSIRGLSDTPKDTHTDRVQRQIVAELACKLGDAVCSRVAIEHITAQIIGRKHRISPDVETSLYCSAVANGGDPVWLYILSSYLNNPKDSARYLAALSCSTDAENIRSFIINSIPLMPVEQWTERVSAFASKKENSDVLLNIIHQNINIIINKYGTKTLSSVLLQFTKYLTTKKQINVLQDIERLGVGGLTAEIAQIDIRRAWLEKNVPLILTFFKSNLNFGLITS
ncbi:aminopeptidase N [Halyomorpha halys]|uniref:aminopeptidase N n=2 Tax=Halyomorpha halys TaxID=286706 RepID=UPI0034D1EE30